MKFFSIFGILTSYEPLLNEKTTKIMNCKNCNFELNPKDNFCKECGAKIVRERITIKNLFSNLLDTLGWDSNFFVTLRYLFYKPQIVSKEYINGARKKIHKPLYLFCNRSCYIFLCF